MWKQLENTNYIVSDIGEVVLTTKDKLIKQFPGGTGGYMMVNIYYGGGINRIVAVHRLVAEVFIPNPLGKLTVNHINGNKLDNSVGNLAWATYSENNKHAADTGLNAIGSSKVNAKLDEHKVMDIKKMMLDGIRDAQISKLYSVHCGTINQIRQGRTWKHVKLPDAINDCV